MNSLNVVLAKKVWHFLVAYAMACSSSSMGAYLVSAEVNVLDPIWIVSNCG